MTGVISLSFIERGQILHEIGYEMVTWRHDIIFLTFEKANILEGPRSIPVWWVYNYNGIRLWESYFWDTDILSYERRHVWVTVGSSDRCFGVTLWPCFSSSVIILIIACLVDSVVSTTGRSSWNPIVSASLESNSCNMSKITSQHYTLLTYCDGESIELKVLFNVFTFLISILSRR